MHWSEGSADDCARGLAAWERSARTGPSVFAAPAWWRLFADTLPRGTMQWWRTPDADGGVPILRYRRFGVETLMTGPLGQPGGWFGSSGRTTNPLATDDGLRSLLRAAADRRTGRVAIVPASGAVASPGTRWQNMSHDRRRWVLALDADPASRYADGHKRNIAKAETLNPRLSCITTVPGVVATTPLWRQTFARQRGATITRSPAFRHALFESLQPSALARWYVAETDDTPVVAIIVLIDGDTAIYFDGATTRDPRQAGAGHWLFDRMLRELAAEGFRCFDFGASPPGAEGLERFKQGWGAAPTSYIAYDFRRRWYSALARGR